MAKLDAASYVFLAFWPGLPLVIILWGLLNAWSARQMIHSLTAETAGIITQSLSTFEGEYDEEHGDSRRAVLSIRFDYEVDGTKYTSGTFAPKNKVPWSARGSSFDEVATKYVVGESYPAWYNPSDPSKAYLVTGSMWDHATKMWWGLYIFLGIFVMLAALVGLSKMSS